MKKIFKNRVFVGAVCMLLAGIIAFIGIPAYNNLSLKRVDIVCAKKDISVGTKITSDMVETVEKGKINLPSGTVGSLKYAVGKYATTDIQKGDQLTTRKISKTLSLPNVKLRSLDPDEEALTIAPKGEAATFGYHLLPNDIVSIYQVTSKGTELVNELTYISVVVTTTSTGTQILKENQTDSDGNSLIPSTITFIVNQAQAKKLIALSNNGNFYLVLKYRGNDDKIRQKYINAQNEYFNGSNSVGTVDSDTDENSSSSAYSK